MSLSYDEQFLDLLHSIKSYFSRLDPGLYIDLSSEELDFFSEEIATLSPKIRKRKEKKEDFQKQVKYTAPSPQKPLERTKKISEPLPPPPLVSPTTSIKLKPSILSKPQKKNKDTPIETAFTTLEKTPASELNFGDVKTIMKEIAPNYPILDTIPSDKRAKDISQTWKLRKRAAEISIITFRESPQQLLFLKNLSQALDITYLPTKIISAIDIEQENKWNLFLSQPDLKLIIACDYSILGLPNLIKHYKEIPAHRQHFLSDIPLFMLPDISLYFKDPMLKKSLWTSLKNKILLLVDK